MENICKILKEAKTIAIVGLSSNPNKTSRQIADFLILKGYSVVGVNPATDTAGNIICYKNLSEIPFPVDIIDIFRPSKDIPFLTDEIISIKPKLVWLQLGIKNNSEIEKMKNAGIDSVQNKCIKIEYQRCF